MAAKAMGLRQAFIRNSIRVGVVTDLRLRDSELQVGVATRRLLSNV